MPFFSFSLKKNFLINSNFENIYNSKIKENNIYFSKNAGLWKHLNKKKYSQYINFISFEERKKINSFGESILLCLPPNLGLGDIIEYSLFIQSLIISRRFKRVGVAFTGKYKNVISNYFKRVIQY